MARSKLESSLSKEVIELLESLGYVVVNVIVSSRDGCSDILCCSPTGMFVAIELKVGNNKPSESQKAFVHAVKANKGIAFIAWTLQDVIKGINGIELQDGSEEPPKQFLL